MDIAVRYLYFAMVLNMDEGLGRNPESYPTPLVNVFLMIIELGQNVLACNV